jgi:hypothetical protein
MFLIIDNGCYKGHGAGHPDMGQGDDERSLFIRRSNAAEDTAIIAGIR